MPGWLNAVIGAAEVTAGGLVAAGTFGGGWPLAIPLIVAGAEGMASGIYTQLQGQPLHGGSSAERNPIAPWEICYGQGCVGGTPLYINYFGNNNKWLDIIFDVGDHPSQGVTQVMLDKNVVSLQLMSSPGVPGDPTPGFIKMGISAPPLPQNTEDPNGQPNANGIRLPSPRIYQIVRFNGIVTCVTETNGAASGDISTLTPGDLILATNIPDASVIPTHLSSMNGKWRVQTVAHYTAGDPRWPTPPGGYPAQNSGAYCIITWISGGVDENVIAAGYISTQWVNFGSRVWVEVLTGAQALGETFYSIINGTPNPSDPNNPGNLITYTNQGYGGSPWTAYCSGVGRTMVFIRLNYDASQLPYIPQLTAVKNGKCDIYDPRLGPCTGLGTRFGPVSAVAIATPGTGYSVGDVLTVAQAGASAGTLRVATLNGSGGVATFIVTSPGTGYSVASDLSVTGGAGTGATITINALGGSAGTVGYTTNWALCVADYLTDQIYGFKMQYGVDLNTANLISAANICDETVPLAAGGTEPRYTVNGRFTTDMGRGEILDELLKAGAGRIVESGGQYNLIPGVWLASYGQPAEYNPTTTYALGQWVMYGTLPYQSLVNGNVGNEPDLYSSVWLSPQAPSMAAMTGPVEWSSVSQTELYNGVKGTFIFSGNNWESSDYPFYAQDSTHGYTLGIAGAWTSGHAFSFGDYTVYDGIGYQSIYPGTGTNTGHEPDTSPAYWAQSYQDILLTADGGDRRWMELSLRFTTSASMAQRVAKIALMRARQFEQATVGYDLYAYRFTAQDVMTLSVPQFDWDYRIFEVLSSRFIVDGLALRTEFAIRTTDASVYDWNPTTEELTPAGYQQPTIPTGLNPAPPTEVAVSSSSATAWVNPSGIAQSRLLVTWTEPTDGLVLSGGHIECQYAAMVSPAPLTIGPWVSVASVDPTLTQLYIADVVDGQYYYVQIRSVNFNGIPSVWVEATPAPIVATGSAYLSIAPPGDVTFSIDTDGEGNIIVSYVGVQNADGTSAAGVTAIVYDVYYVDATMQATSDVAGALTPTATDLTYSGIPPSNLSQAYCVIGYGNPAAEIVYVSNPSAGLNQCTISRGELGTTAEDWSSINTTISAVNALWPLELTIPAALNIIPGMRARNSTPPTNSFVTEYNPTTGLVRLTAPLGNTPAPSGAIDFFHVIVPLSVVERNIPVPLGYFSGPNQPTMFDSFSLPSSAIMFVFMKAHNNYSPTGTGSTGSDSAWFQTNGAYPQTNRQAQNPIYTHGGYEILWTYQQIPVGDNPNAFQRASAPQTQDFGSVCASIANISASVAQPIPTPAPITDIRLSSQVPTATIAVTGTADPSMIVFAMVPGVASSSWWVAAVQGITGASTLAQVATSLSNFLNADSVFGTYYTCSASGSTISVIDLNNVGGSLQVPSVSSGTTIFAPSGFTSALGILTGSFYSAAYVDTTDSYIGSATPFNAEESTGPTGSYFAILLANIPVSSDSRVNQINIYRSADGTPYGLASPLYLVGTVANSSPNGSGFTTFTDTTLESALTGLTQYPGPTQPTSANDVVIKVSQNENLWFELHVPPGGAMSNVIPGTAIRGLGTGASLTAEVVNNYPGPLDVTIDMD